MSSSSHTGLSPSYHIATAYLRVILQANNTIATAVKDKLGFSLDEALEAEYISGELINKLLEIMSIHGVQSLAIDFGEQLDVGNHGPVGFAALSAPNLGTAIEILGEFIIIRASGVEAQFKLGTQRATYILRDVTGHDLVGRWLIESSFLVAKRLVETITVHPLGDAGEYRFVHPQPAYHHQLKKLLGKNCHFNCSDNSFSFPSSWAAIPSPLSDPDLFRSNIAKCRELKLSLGADKSDVVSLVETRLLNHFERRISGATHAEKIPSLNILAQELFMSPRTLIRKLAKRRTSYQQILDCIRSKEAERLLRSTHNTAAEIAQKLGYLEAANFGRAFKRWHGKSPSAWRRQH